MKLPYLSQESLQHFISTALAEDVGTGAGAGDHSSLASIPLGQSGQAQLLIKGEGILAGVALAGLIFDMVDPELNVDYYKHDGDKVKPGDVGLVVEGNMRSVLQAERLVLNCMQRMSGIATKTHNMAKLIAGTKAKLLDTRKTTPNFRIAEKWAVAIGGGKNHRFGLYDMVILKDNHVDTAGGIRQAIESTTAYLKENKLKLNIEIETRNLEEVAEVLATGGVQVIMLDNMPPDMMQQAVAMIGGKYKTEASGGISESTIRAVAETGVDFISVGALTHSYQSMDISLKVIK